MRGDSVLLNPETMKVLGVAIACPVVVSRGWCNGVGRREEEEEERGEKEPAVVCCKAWPLASMPLDGKPLAINMNVGEHRHGITMITFPIELCQS